MPKPTSLKRGSLKEPVTDKGNLVNKIHYFASDPYLFLLSGDEDNGKFKINNEKVEALNVMFGGGKSSLQTAKSQIMRCAELRRRAIIKKDPDANPELQVVLKKENEKFSLILLPPSREHKCLEKLLMGRYKLLTNNEYVLV